MPARFVASTVPDANSPSARRCLELVFIL
jgi:hypothetical protein